MKMFTFLSCLFGSAVAAPSGDLTVTYNANKQIVVQGQLTGLPADTENAGIHIHEGKVCTYSEAVGGHLWSNHIDGWAYPEKTTYDTSATGVAGVDVTANYFTLAEEDGTLAIPAVENRCVVLHGVTDANPNPRVAVGQILKNDDGEYKATITHYPGLELIGDYLGLTPAGELAVTLEDTEVRLQGSVTGLGASLTAAGIHIHSGTDCSGGDNPAEYNTVIGGHLYSKGDGFSTTKYTSNATGVAGIDFSTPKDSYTLLTADETDEAPSVEDRCIVIHAGDGSRIGVGQIVCTDGACTAAMGEYPAALCVNNDAGDGCTTDDAACNFADGECSYTTPATKANTAGMITSITTMAVVAAMLW